MNYTNIIAIDEKGNHRLKANTCTKCNIAFFPMRDICTNCYSENYLKEIFLADEGTLYGFTVVYRSFPQFKTPYVIGYVDIDENKVRVFGQIDMSEPEKLKTGTPMKVVFDKNSENVIPYYFKTAGGA